ncbi:MAG: Ig-like domain-containing protein, partial [Candidatus Helarchaeota archaeon]
MNIKRVSVSVAIATSFIVLMSSLIGSYYTGLTTHFFLNDLDSNNENFEIDGFELNISGYPNSSDLLNYGCGKWFYEYIPEWNVNSSHNSSFFDLFGSYLDSNFEELVNKTCIKLNLTLNSSEKAILKQGLSDISNTYINNIIKPYFDMILGPDEFSYIPVVQLTDEIMVEFNSNNYFYKIQIIDDQENVIESILGLSNGRVTEKISISPEKYIPEKIYSIKIGENEHAFKVVKEKAILLTQPITTSTEINPNVQLFLIEDENLLYDIWPFDEMPSGITDKEINFSILQNNGILQPFTDVLTDKNGMGQTSLLNATPTLVLENYPYDLDYVFKPKIKIYQLNLSFNEDQIYKSSETMGIVIDISTENIVSHEFIESLIKLNESEFENKSVSYPDNDLFLEEDELGTHIEQDSFNNYSNLVLNLNVNVTSLMEYVDLQINCQVKNESYPVADETIDLYLGKDSIWSYLGSCTTNFEGVAYYQNILDLPSGDYQVKAVLNNNRSLHNCSTFSIKIPNGLIFSDSIGHSRTKFVDMINCDIEHVNYSDIAEYRANITTIYGTPFEDVNVTFIVFNHTENYPENIKKFSKYEDHFDEFWFYLYWYSDKDHKCQRHFTDISNPHFDQVRNSCWAHVIGSAMTDEQGIAEVQHSTYLFPGSYHVVAVVDFATSLSDCLKEQLDIEHTWLYRIFHDCVNVSQEESKLIPLDLEVRYSDQSDIIIYLMDNEGDPHTSLETLNVPHEEHHIPIIETKKLSFYMYLNGSWIPIGENTTNNNGSAVISYTPWILPGNYSLKVYFSGDSLYRESEAVFNVTVEKEFVRFRNVDFIARYSDPSYLETQLQDDEGNPIPQFQDILKTPRNVSYYIYYYNTSFFNLTLFNQTSSNITIMIQSENNQTQNITVEMIWYHLGEVPTDYQGLAKLNYTPWIKPDNYTMLVSFLGDDYYKPLVKYGNLTVQKEHTFLEFYTNKSVLQQENPNSINNYTMRYSDTINITVRLSDDEGHLFPKARAINFTVDDLWFQDITDSNGTVIHAYTTWLLLANYNLTSMFYGDEYFISSNKSIPLQIDKEITEIVPLADLTFSDPGLLMVNLTDDEGIPVSNKTAIIQITFPESTFLSPIPVFSNGIGYLP